jgi:uncharacterized membrane protein YkgB
MSVPRTSELEGRDAVGPLAQKAAAITRAGRTIALAGVILPLLMIGGMKFTAVEIAALKPLISGTPWLAWMYPVFGEPGASYVLGVVEISTALLLIACPWSARAGVAGGALATLTFLVTCSVMLALPIWEPTLGFPALGPAGQFLIKDVALLGIALVVLGESLGRSNRPRLAGDRT